MPSAISAANGGWLQSAATAGTTSEWLISTSVRPPPRARQARHQGLALRVVERIVQLRLDAFGVPTSRAAAPTAGVSCPGGFVVSTRT